MRTNGAVSSFRQHSCGACAHCCKTLWRQRMCVRQNRVVLAVVATVKLFAEVHGAQPGEVHRSSARRGRPERIRLPGEHGINRQPTAQGRPSDWHHLYAAVRFSCATFSRSGPRVRGQHPVFPAPSWIGGRNDEAKLGRNAPRECECASVRDRSARLAREIRGTTAIEVTR